MNSEVELAQILVSWLKEQGWEVYQEVSFGSIADIVAKKDDKYWIIECKMTFGIKVIEQALEWKNFAHYISIAIPRKTKSNYHGIMSYFPMGIITISDNQYTEKVKIDKVAPELEVLFLDKLKKHLFEQQKDCALAGSKAATRFTTFKNTVCNLEIYLKEHPGASIKVCVANIKHHYASPKSAESSLIKMINKRVIKTIEIHKLPGNKTELYLKGRRCRKKKK